MRHAYVFCCFSLISLMLIRLMAAAVAPLYLSDIDITPH